MAKTGKQVQGDIYQLLKDSVLYTQISGEVYRQGCRPRDSRKEDAVVIFTAGLPAQIQSGVVTVNIFVPDIDPYGNGVLVEDCERTAEVELLAQRWADSLTAEVSCYLFRLQQTVCTEAEPAINQHFVVVKLVYEYFGEDDAGLNIPQAASLLDESGFLTVMTEDDDIPVTTPIRNK